MKVAILITGQARFIDQGAWWLRNRVFPDGCGIDVDYFCHFWNDGSDNLIHRAKHVYATEHVTIDDYSTVLKNHMDYIIHKNKTEYTDWSHVPKHIQENMLFNTDYITDYGKNWHGQYLSAGIATETYKDELSKYDIVIKTRSDCIMNDMSIREWKAAFSNIHKNPVLRDKIFPEWLYIKASQPFHGDFTFIARPSEWIRYGTNLIPGLRKICTKEKHWFKETDVDAINFPSHWMWNKLSMYSKNDWLSFGVVWPTRYNVTLVRDEDFVYGKNYEEIKQRFENTK